jgi:hypothetical protein
MLMSAGLFLFPVMALSSPDLTSASHTRCLSSKTDIKNDQLLMRFRDGVTRNQQEQVLSAFSLQVVHHFKLLPILLVARTEKTFQMKGHDFLRQLLKNSHVLYAEPNFKINALGTSWPNDPYFNRQWALYNTGLPEGLKGADIAMVPAWQTVSAPKPVLVGVVDTGIDCRHHDLERSCWVNPGESGLDASGQDKSKNEIDDDHNGFVDDWQGWNFFEQTNDASDNDGHGTHVAGIIGATRNNHIGVAGVNPFAQLVPIKFMGSFGGTLNHAIQAMEYMATMGITISNQSWGVNAYSQALYDAVMMLNAKGHLLVASGGNANENSDEHPVYPAGFLASNVISVGASNIWDQKADISNYGPRTIDLFAPGENIFSTWLGQDFKTLTGTSMAAPYVTGVASLLWTQHSLTVGELKRRILYSGDTIKYFADLSVTSKRINAFKALNKTYLPPVAIADMKLRRRSLTGLELAVDFSVDDWGKVNDLDFVFKIFDHAHPTEDEWDSSQSLFIGEKLCRNHRCRIHLRGINAKTRGFLIGRTYNANGRFGMMSTAVAVPLPVLETIRKFVPSDIDGFVTAGGWGRELLNDGTEVFSDSPYSTYHYSTTSELLSPKIEVRADAVHFEMAAYYDFEASADFLNLYVRSSCHKNWKKIKSWTGNSLDFLDIGISVDLCSEVAATAAWLQFKLELKADASDDRNGVLVKDIAVKVIPAR